MCLEICFSYIYINMLCSWIVSLLAVFMITLKINRILYAVSVSDISSARAWTATITFNGHCAHGTCCIHAWWNLAVTTGNGPQTCWKTSNNFSFLFISIQFVVCYVLSISVLYFKTCLPQCLHIMPLLIKFIRLLILACSPQIKVT